MKQNTFKWLSYSLLLFFLFSCKKEKGALDDLPRGRFNFVFSWSVNGIEKSIDGEVSGPYQSAGNYGFQIRPEINMEYSTVGLSRYDGIYRIGLAGLGLSDITANVTSKDHDSDNLNIQFQSGDTLSGLFKLSRIE